MSKRPIDMRKEYDFTNMKGRRNPYAKVLKKQVTLRLGVDVIEKDLVGRSPPYISKNGFPFSRE